MRKQCLIAISFVLVSGLGIAAQSGKSKAKIEEEVRAADTGMFEAVNTCDQDKWNRIVADDMVLLIVGGRAFDKVTLHGDFFGKTMHPVPCDTEYTNEPMKVRSYGDVAIVTGNTSYKGNGKGRPREVQRFVFTRVYEWRNGAWRFVLGQHTTTKERQTGAF